MGKQARQGLRDDGLAVDWTALSVTALMGDHALEQVPPQRIYF